MRVLQLIDSLQPGGAEKMAVNMANALVPHVDGTFLCCTRQEGMLKDEIKQEVGYLFLNKKSRFDLMALMLLKKYIKEKEIDIIHAHGTSFLGAFLIKVTNPSLKLVWHDHLGSRATKSIYSFPVLYFCSLFFAGVIAVNENLLVWANSNLLCNNIIFIPNFLPTKGLNFSGLRQNGKNFSLVYVANLKKPKNHLNLLKAFKMTLEKFPDSLLYLAGKRYNDDYEKNILDYILLEDLQKKVFLPGETSEIGKYLDMADIGVISSDSEGLSMALLEYGLAGLAVICTDVGENAAVIGPSGKIVEINNPKALAEKIIFYLENEKERKQDAENFHKLIVKNYTEDKVIPEVVKLYKSLKF